LQRSSLRGSHLHGRLWLLRRHPAAADHAALVSTAIAVTPFDMRPTPTLPTGRDFYHVQRVTNTATGAFRPAVSPDGQRVAYASERDGNWDIYVIELSTSAETRLTDDPLNDMAPSWSPDGSQIAYQHNVPSADGPVLVDRIVMNADGSNKVAVSSGAHWLGNEAPAWSPAGDRIAFADSNAIVIASVADRREVQRLAAPDNQGAYAPAWFDDQRVLFVGNGQLMLGDVDHGAVQQVLGLSGPVNFGMAAKSKIIYVGQNGATQIGEVQLDGTQPMMWANFPPGSINHAELSPDGKFVAVQADSGLYAVTNGLPASWQSQPLFRLDQNVPPSDLLSVSWLPNSSGFVFVSLADGNRAYLAQLNMSAIDYLKSLSSSDGTPAPTLNPADTEAVSSIAASFWPDPSVPVDESTGFSFGATITATSPISVYTHIVAFVLRTGEVLEDCTTPPSQPIGRSGRIRPNLRRGRLSMARLSLTRMMCRAPIGWWCALI
jgi:WD40 repeat protein